jgi:hypothetical protein
MALDHHASCRLNYSQISGIRGRITRLNVLLAGSPYLAYSGVIDVGTWRSAISKSHTRRPVGTVMAAGSTCL